MLFGSASTDSGRSPTTNVRGLLTPNGPTARTSWCPGVTPSRADDPEREPLEPEERQARVVEPERVDPFQVRPAERDIDRLARLPPRSARGS